MQHRMAVRADGPQIGYRIEVVFLPNVGKWGEVVDVDEPFTYFPVSSLEVEAANDTGMSPVRDTP